jgi:hypothetical protein
LLFAARPLLLPQLPLASRLPASTALLIPLRLVARVRPLLLLLFRLLLLLFSTAL